MLFGSRKLISLCGRIVVSALLFTQFVVAAEACVIPGMAPAMTFSSDPASEPCHEMDRNACLVQSLLPDQALDTTHQSELAPPAVSPLVVALNEPVRIRSSAAVPLGLSGPPICIRVCRLLN